MCIKYLVNKRYSCGKQKIVTSYSYCSAAKTRAGSLAPGPEHLCPNAPERMDSTDTWSKCEPSCTGSH